MEDLNSTSPSSASAMRPGPFYGYVIVAASFFVLMIAYGSQYSFGIFFKPVLEEFGWTRALTSGAYSLNVALQGVFAVISGRLIDRFGPRLVLTFSGVFLGLGYLLMSRTGAVWHIYLFYGVLISIGAAGSYVPLLATVARWFEKGRGLACGILVAGIGVGITIMPRVANQLISSYSWRTSYLVIGLSALVIIITAAQFLRRDPGQMGLVAYGADAIGTQSTATEVEGLSAGESLRTRQFWILLAVFLSSNFTVQVAMVHIVPHATDLSIPAGTAASILSVIGALNIGSRVAMGIAIDRYGTKPVVIAMLVLMTAAFLWLLLAGELWMFYVFAVIFAFAYGSFAAVSSPVIAEYFGLKAQGAILGLVMMGNFIGGATGPLMAGRVFDTTGSYGPAFLVGAALSIASLVAVLFLKPVRLK